MRIGTVAKEDVLVHIEGYGEFEIIVPFERVAVHQVIAGKEEAPIPPGHHDFLFRRHGPARVQRLWIGRLGSMATNPTR